jgi:hypothetical protein
MTLPTKRKPQVNCDLRSDTPTVPCRLCGTPTPMTGTKLCNSCWELETRIQGDPYMARKILVDTLSMKTLIVRHTGDCSFIRPASEAAEIQGGDYGFVCDLLRLDKGGRARCNCDYPPRYCPLTNSDVLVTVRK